MKSKITYHHIHDEVTQIQKEIPALKADAAFVLWFLRAFLAESNESAQKALTGTSRDKGIDAILVDQNAKQIHILQGKLRQSLGEVSENRNDVLAFIDIANTIRARKGEAAAFHDKLDPLTLNKVIEASSLLKQGKYSLQLYYVTTGKCSDVIKDEARTKIRKADGLNEFSIVDSHKVATIFRDYIEGVAPAVPTMILKMSSESTANTDGCIHRFEPDTKIESWVFSMTAKDVGEMYTKAGIRLFARNVRGYLGESPDINKAMATTIGSNPRNFWYYNNGVTIVCDDATEETQRGQKVLRVDSPQVINGQQTTRTLHKTKSERASLLVKVIKIPRTKGDEGHYHDLTSHIVRATNWQNAITPIDLISNDPKQVFLERELRKHRYQYLRKRQSKAESKVLYGQGYTPIKNEEMAKAVAACEFDPATVLKGKTILFDDKYYQAIFKSSSISFYLSRYWLMRHVLSGAYGTPAWSYAKWLVLHFVWDTIGSDINSGERERKFRSASESKYQTVIDPLRAMINISFKLSLQFYKAKSGKGDKAMDRQTFFKQSGLSDEFKSFWNSSKNNKKLLFKRKYSRFKLGLEEVDI